MDLGISILTPYCYEPNHVFDLKSRRPHNRNTAIEDFCTSINNTAKEPNIVEVILGIHPQDGSSRAKIDALNESLSIEVRYVFIEGKKDGKLNMSFMWNQIYSHAKHGIVGFFGDDVLFKTPGWDVEVVGEFSKDRYVMVSCNDVTYQRGAKAVLFFTHKEFHNKLGFYMNERYKRWFMDFFLDEIFRRMGKLHYRGDIITEHLNPLLSAGDAGKLERKRILEDQEEWNKTYDAEVKSCLTKFQ